ncbi:MAG: sulfurtransferase TusA family protein [Nitrospirae bacterium]|nr:sulfurtransferase TusA family protein [Nitrospirota bacterium]
MVRVKVPQGTLNPEQLKRLADIGDRFSTGIAHTSSRQDIQFHYVKLENVPTVMRLLAEVGLTTREACGNTVRNVTGCYLAGTCPDEVFDVSPYATLTTSYFLRNPVCQSLPRKFKIAFSGCSKDCAMAPINDIGAIAVKREVNGTEKSGFRIYIAGGLGPHPKIAQLLDEFIPAEDLIPLSEAILRVFDQYGEKKSRSRARMKFLLEKIGFEELKQRVLKEFQILKTSRTWSLTLPSGDNLENPSIRPFEKGGTGNGDPYFHRWHSTNVLQQKQDGYHTVNMRLVMGDITTEQMRRLADITTKYAHGRLKVTQQQNFIMKWVRGEDLHSLYLALKEEGLALAGAGRMIDIQSCPGAETCNLGLTSSRQLAFAIGRELAAHHHIADIGFHGVAKKIDGRLVPHYQLHLRGGIGNNRAVIGDSNIKLPAKNIPDAVSRLVSLYQEERLPGELFYQYIDRAGLDYIQEFLGTHTSIPSFAESPDDYYDWGSERDFVVKLGAGECAGGVVDLIEDCLISGSREAAEAALLFDAGQVDEALKWVERAIISISKGMLVPFGIDTEVEAELLREFQDKIIDKCIVSGSVEPLFTDYGKPASKEKIKEKISLAKILARESQEAYSQIDKNFKFRQREEESKEEVKRPMERKIDAKLDLKGVACPYNFVKTKLKLDEMDAGQVLQIIIDDGEPYQNVPRSVLNEGHKILEEEKIEDKHYRIVIEKA